MGVYKDKRDGHWRYRKWVSTPGGQRVRINGTSKRNTKAAAEAAQREHADRVMHAATDADPTTLLYLEITPEVATALRTLRTTGFFGKGLAEIAEELLRRALLDPTVTPYWRTP